jgi:hypothetical protein
MNAAQPAQQTTTPREYTYTKGDVVYRGEKAREMETAQGLYDSGDYDWNEAQMVARKLLETQKAERKLKVQDTVLALGDHMAKLQQKEIDNNMIGNRQAALSELALISTDDVVNFSKKMDDWRTKNQKAVAFDDAVQKLATQKIKEQEFHATQMKNMLHASGVDAFVPEVINKDGSVDMSKASEVGLKMKESQLKMAEDAKARLASRKASEARLTEELTGKTPASALEIAQRNVKETGANAEVTVDGTKYTITPTSMMQADALRAQSMKQEEEARKKGMPTKAPTPEAPKFDPNDMVAAKKFMLEKQKEFADVLGEDEASAQKLIELARRKGFNIR